MKIRLLVAGFGPSSLNAFFAKPPSYIPFYRDKGFLTNNGFGVMNRQTNTVGDQQALEALVQAAK